MKRFIIFLLMLSMLLIASICYASQAPVYDPAYNNNNGAFYANGTPIVISQNAENQTVITWNAGSQVVPSTVVIYGGGREGTNYESSNITMNGGEVSSIIGGGASVEEALPAIVGNTNIIVNHGTVLNSIAGGGVLYSQVDQANIVMNQGTVAAIVGGGIASATVDGVYYSIGSEENPQASPNRTNLAYITIMDGTVNSPLVNYGLVYVGGQGYSYVGDTTLIINSGDLSNAYVTAGGSNGYTGEANVEMNGGTIHICQSVNRGIVEQAQTKVTGGNIQEFYVGGETGDVTVTGTINQIEVALLDGTIQSLNAGKSNSQPIVIDESNYTVLKTDDVEIITDNILEEEQQIIYQLEGIPSQMEMEVGETFRIPVQVKTVPEGYERLFHEIRFQSENEEIVTVSEEGMITGIKEGNTTITVSLLEEQSQVEVEVTSQNEEAWIYIALLLILLLLLLFIGVYFWGFEGRF